MTSINYQLVQNYPESVVGLFWLSKDDMVGSKNDVSNNQNFNPSRNTVIICHGWQNGSIKRNELFNLYSMYSKLFTQNEWINNNWNVGVFRWIPFADDDDVTDLNSINVAPCNTECKIHVLNGLTGMRYREKDGNTFKSITDVSSKLFGKTVRDMFVDEYSRFFSNITKHDNQEIRILGHSLGGQLAMVTTAAINATVNLPKVDRLELLDPYYTGNYRQYYKLDSGNLTYDGYAACISRNALQCLNPDSDNPNVAVVWYQCTSLTNVYGISDSNDAMKKPVVWEGVRFWYISDLNQAERHSAIIPWYFQTLNYNPPQYIYTGTKWWSAKWLECPNESGFSANTSISYIKQNMNLKCYWIQANKSYGVDDTAIKENNGATTFKVNDDIFAKEIGDYASSVDLLEIF